MADHVQPDAGEEREGASSGLLLSVDPLQGGKNYKLAGDDSDADGTDVSDADGTDTGLDADGMDPLGIQPENADGSDADGTDAK